MNYEQFVEALKDFCIQHGYEIAGTCVSEGIYGEILVIEAGKGEDYWHNWDKTKFNFREAE